LKQPYFILVVAHSLHGRLQRVHVPHQFAFLVAGALVIAGALLFGLASSYVRMSLKVANYNQLRQEVDALRVRYSRLEKESRQANQSLASLQLLANEVSIAYGIKRALEGPDEISSEGRLVPTISESLSEYNFLKSARLSRHFRRRSPLLSASATPSIWPVEGKLNSYFGHRMDPFLGGSAFHAGIDIGVSAGTAVKVTADGVVQLAEHCGSYGKLVIVEHGSGFETYYAHLSGIEVVEGQEIRRGEIVGRSGNTGRSSAPHVHYEVRRGGTPINPYPYMSQPLLARAKIPDFPF